MKICKGYRLGYRGYRKVTALGNSESKAGRGLEG